MIRKGVSAYYLGFTIEEVLTQSRTRPNGSCPTSSFRRVAGREDRQEKTYLP
jgi:hypothetical protein